MSLATVRLGKNGYMYRNTGTYGTPVWDLVDNVTDLDVPMDAEEADASGRYSGWVMSEPTLKKMEVNFGMFHDTADTDFVAIQAAFDALTSLEFLILDRATGVGAFGLRATLKIFSFRKGERLKDLQKYDVIAKPCFYTVAPAFYTGA